MHRRHLWVEYADRSLSLIYPVRECDVPTLDILLAKLQERWIEQRFILRSLLHPTNWQLVEAVARLLPSPKGLALNLNTLQQDENLRVFERLFLPAVGEPSQLAELHQFELPDGPRWQVGQALTVADLPFPSCGDRYADQLASLIYNFQPPDAQKVWSWLDQETRCRAQQVLLELNKPAEERIEAYTRSVFEDWKAQNQEQFEEELYGDW